MPPKQSAAKEADAPPANPTDRRPKRVKAQDCAILVDYQLAQVVGGKLIGWPSKHRSLFINSRGDDVSQAFVGVRIIVPRDPYDTATYLDHIGKPMQDHVLTLKLWHASFTYAVAELPEFVRDTLPTVLNKEIPAERVSVICLKLKDGHRAFLDGLDIPTTTASLGDCAALFFGFDFDGVKPLLDLAAQREFRIIVADEDPQKTPRKWFLQGLVLPQQDGILPAPQPGQGPSWGGDGGNADSEVNWD